MSNQTKEMTAEKFAEIYTNEKLRNEVARAHVCCLAGGSFSHMSTCGYPVSYKVSDEQIKEAKAELARAKVMFYKEHENDLIFTGMGMDYESRFEDDVCNHRIRTELVNPNGRHFFIEVSHYSENHPTKADMMWVNFSIDRDLELKCEKYKVPGFNGQPYYNYGNIERGDSPYSSMKYTKQNVLKIVNEVYGCNFKNIIIDSHTAWVAEYISHSPKK